MRKRLTYFIVFIWIALIAVFLTELYTYAFTYGLGVKDALLMLSEDAQHVLMGFGYASFFFFVLLYAIRPLIFFPASVMTVTSVFLFGTLGGFIVSYVGEMLSALIAFFAGKYFGQELGLDKKVAHSNIGSHLHGNAFTSVLILRFIPIFPFDVVSYASGIAKLPFGAYASGTLLGVLPGLSAYIFLGFSLVNTEYIIGVLMMFVVLVGLGHLTKKYINRKR